MCTKYNRKYLIDILIQYNININFKDINNNTSFILAGKNKNLEVMKLLIDYGVDINIMNRVNKKGIDYLNYE